jgi:hypothetical protein
VIGKGLARRQGAQGSGIAEPKKKGSGFATSFADAAQKTAGENVFIASGRPAGGFEKIFYVPDG